MSESAKYDRILRELVAEREAVDAAIRAVMPLITRGKKRGPGRPPVLDILRKFRRRAGAVAK